MAKGKSKKKKSKKQKKVVDEEEAFEEDADVVDLDDAPVDIDAGEEEEESSEEVDDNVEASRSQTMAVGSYEEEEKAGKKSPISFSKAEMPLLGYALASFVFFLAAVGKRARRGSLGSTNNLAVGMAGAQAANNMANNLFEGIIDEFDIEDDSVENVMDGIFDSTWIDDDWNTNYDDDFGLGLDQMLGNVCGMGFGRLRNSYYAYALCLGIFGMLMAGALIGWMKYNASLAAKREETKASRGGIEDDGSAYDDENKSVSELFLENHGKWFNLFLFLWAFIGWAIFTFGGDNVFRFTGNGFFALWAMMLFSIWNLGVTMDTLAGQAQKSDSYVYAMGLGSIITIIELTSVPFFRWQPNYRIASYAVSVSVLGLIFGLLIAGFSLAGGDKLNAKIQFWTLAVLLVMWLVAACLTTFVGPFITTGNGYFAVWASTIFTGMAFADVQSELQ